MPHIIIEKLEKPTLPARYSGFEFEFISEGDNGVVGVQTESFRFLLEFFQHKKGVLVKPDKTTRVPHLNVNKLALQALADLTQSNIVQSNIETLKQQREYKNLVSREALNKKIAALDYQEIWLEIGFGSGRHILHNSHNNPEVLHIGIEVHRPSTEQLLKQCEIHNISNILVLLDDARVILETLPADALSKIFVHFPVPWDDSPTKRIFSSNFIQEASFVLKQKGTLELRTDSPNYYTFVRSLYDAMNKFAITIRKNGDLPVVSKYETRWRKQEKDIYDIIYYNDEVGGKEQEEFDFSFPTCNDFSKAIAQFTDKGYRDNQFLVKFLKTFQIAKNIRVHKLVMGKLAFPQAIYILEDNEQISYYPKLPFFAKENYLAHKKIVESLQNGK